MKKASRIFQLCALCGVVSAFSGTALPRQLGVQNKQLSPKFMTKEDNEDIPQNGIRAFGVAASILALSFVGEPVQAAPSSPNSPTDHVILSSSMQLSETIKTMDFSLPSSYDSISDAKSSGVDELVQEENVLTGTKVKKATKASPSSNDGFNIGGPQLTPEEKAAQAAQIKAAREAATAEKKALEAEKQAEREAIAAAKKAEKEALDAERAEQRAIVDAERASKAKAAKEARAQAESAKASKAADAKLAGADFVDMGLPSYGDSTSSKAKSAFSI